jgi:hypothetical protein
MVVGNHGIVAVLCSYREGPYFIEVSRGVGRFGTGPFQDPARTDARGSEKRREGSSPQLPVPSVSSTSTRTVVAIMILAVVVLIVSTPFRGEASTTCSLEVLRMLTDTMVLRKLKLCNAKVGFCHEEAIQWADSSMVGD